MAIECVAPTLFSFCYKRPAVFCSCFNALDRSLRGIRSPAELEVVKGSALVGLKYEPMFSFFAERNESFVVCEDNYVTNESGTGIVHQVGGWVGWVPRGWL